MNSFGDVMRNLDWSVPMEILMSIIPALVCITLHELSHGFVAYKLGDNTAKNMGRLTLNPIKHIDIFGLVMMVAFKFGWAKPCLLYTSNTEPTPVRTWSASWMSRWTQSSAPLS